jgi:2-polyprenyl-3-methyl-5-hydroxy-6-metoxy-1,4-benzoquinol methylase
MDTIVKKNVDEFDQDVKSNGGYLYSHRPKYSSYVANMRITHETMRFITGQKNIRSIIDIGCGDGTYTGELKRLLPDIEITGFDPAVEAIKVAEINHPECFFKAGNVLDTCTFPNRRFDLAIMRGVIHHLPTQSEAIANVAKLSNLMLIIEPNGNNPILKFIEKNSKYHIEHEEQSFTSEFLTGICKQYAWNVTSVKYIGFVPFFFPTLPSKIIHLVQPFLERIPILGKYFGAQIVISAERP